MKNWFLNVPALSALDKKALWQRYLLALLAITLTILLTLPLVIHSYLDLTNIAMLFLLMEVIIAVKLGRRPAIMAAFITVIVFNYVYVPPRWEFNLSHTQYIITLIVMLFVALIITQLTEELRQLVVLAVGREQQALDLYRLEQEAQETKLQIAAERLRNSLLSALSHDIRTPLTSIYGLAESLKYSSTHLDSEAQQNLRELQDQAFYLNNMVSNLLEMARLQTGVIKIKKEWQLLDDVIGSSLNLLKPALKDHLIKIDLPDDLPLIEFDAVLIERVLCNLIENATKYSPLNSILTIKATILATDVEVCISNEGDGFPAEKLQQLFELFERGAMESSIPGVGLGLSICRTIIETHAGKIYIHNYPNGCSTCFTLPRGNPPSYKESMSSLNLQPDNTLG